MEQVHEEWVSEEGGVLDPTLVGNAPLEVIPKNVFQNTKKGLKRSLKILIRRKNC